jgi:2',3'-cyclic-nucleotide 2'-phosphodiesterase (5'-nucleotidase family)
MTIAISRRRFVAFLASTAIAPIVPTTALAAPAGFQAIILSDLHSAYERMGQLLAAIENQVAAANLPQVILINGDVFESGNVVGSRSAGEIDWALLAALAKLAPTVINIGNHESDFDNDLAHFVERAGGLGITVLSNIGDKRTGKPFAPASAEIDADGGKADHE